MALLLAKISSSTDSSLELQRGCRRDGFFAAHTFTWCFVKLTWTKFANDRNPTNSINRNLLHSIPLVTLIVSLVHTRLDYCTAVLAGLPTTSLAAFEKYSTPELASSTKPKSSHQRLHWLPMQQCSIFCLSSHVFREQLFTENSSILNVLDNLWHPRALEKKSRCRKHSYDHHRNPFDKLLGKQTSQKMECLFPEQFVEWFLWWS